MTAYKVRIRDWSSDVCSYDLRLADIRSVKDRRNLAQILGVLVGIADFGEEQAAQVFPPTRRIGEQARPVGYAIDIHPSGKGVGTEGETGERHIPTRALPMAHHLVRVDIAGR